MNQTDRDPTDRESTTDRIVKKIVLPAARERVWRAISDAAEFGAWFGVAFDGPFVAGAKMTGAVVPTQADAEIAKSQEPYRGAKFELIVDAIEPPRRFSFRWHPFAVDPAVDYTKEPMTLVEMVLEEARGGTALTITESGFDQLPVGRRAKAFQANDGGWAAQTILIGKHLAGLGPDAP